MIIKLDNDEIREVIKNHIMAKYGSLLEGKNWRANTYLGKSVEWYVAISDTAEKASEEITEATKVKDGRIVW